MISKNPIKYFLGLIFSFLFLGFSQANAEDVFITYNPPADSKLMCFGNTFHYYSDAVVAVGFSETPPSYGDNSFDWYGTDSFSTNYFRQSLFYKNGDVFTPIEGSDSYYPGIAIYAANKTTFDGGMPVLMFNNRSILWPTVDDFSFVDLENVYACFSTGYWNYLDPTNFPLTVPLEGLYSYDAFDNAHEMDLSTECFIGDTPYNWEFGDSFTATSCASATPSFPYDIYSAITFGNWDYFTTPETSEYWMTESTLSHTKVFGDTVSKSSIPEYSSLFDETFVPACSAQVNFEPTDVLKYYDLTDSDLGFIRPNYSNFVSFDPAYVALDGSPVLNYLGLSEVYDRDGEQIFLDKFQVNQQYSVYYLKDDLTVDKMNSDFPISSEAFFVSPEVEQPFSSLSLFAEQWLPSSKSMTLFTEAGNLASRIPFFQLVVSGSLGLWHPAEEDPTTYTGVKSVLIVDNLCQESVLNGYDYFASTDFLFEFETISDPVFYTNQVYSDFDIAHPDENFSYTESSLTCPFDSDLICLGWDGVVAFVNDGFITLANVFQDLIFSYANVFTITDFADGQTLCYSNTAFSTDYQVNTSIASYSVNVPHQNNCFTVDYQEDYSGLDFLLLVFIIVMLRNDIIRLLNGKSLFDGEEEDVTAEKKEL